MLRVLRITLMWLLTLAVPVQGFAAASMLGCGTGHHGTAGSHSHAMGMHERSIAAPQHPHDGDEDELAQADDHYRVGAAGHGDAHKTHASGKFSKASCSVCASCCTSAAPPATPVIFEAADAPDAFVLVASQPVASFISGGPERPPRSILA